MKKVTLIVLDSVGVGALPDAASFGDAGANTIGHIAEQMPLQVPNMLKMGLGHLPGLPLKKDENGCGAYGRAMEKSVGKDTTTGHWEMSGIILPRPFPVYPNGFPEDVIAAFEQAIGTKVLGNKPASGTAILDELGEEHLRTGYPIVYTSADSVFQIAAHERLYPPEKLYEICRIARQQLQGEHGVGRVIARPFIGEKAGAFTRTGNRRDFSLEPIAPTMLDVLHQQGFDTLAVGKIEDIFAMRGIGKSNHASGNPACIDAALDYLKTDFNGLLFVNLVDFDSLYGHRRDVEGYGKALEYFDSRIPEFTALMDNDDLLIITADHGCDPAHHGTDHTREYIPILCFKKGMKGLCDIGTRETFADIAQTVCDYLGAKADFAACSFSEKLEG
ncbi:MAG: phosphopentomutase [Clostridia bacterium]|nr:phosphopentomutase [Clostridia bacterium]